MVTLIHEDCLKAMTNMAEGSVQAVITDPPYGIDGMDENWNHKKLKERENDKSSQTSCIGGLPSSMPFRAEQRDELEAFLIPVLSGCFRLLVPGGFLLSTSQPRLYGGLESAAKVVGFEIRDMWLWEHEGGQGKAFSLDSTVKRSKRFKREDKPAIIKSMGGRKTPQLRPMFEPILVAMKPLEGTFAENWINYRTGLMDTCNDSGMQSVIFRYDKPKNRAKHDGMSVKPMELMKRLIEVVTLPGQVVLDPFMGTGTTGEAAILTERDFIGVEKDEHSFRETQERLEKMYA